MVTKVLLWAIKSTCNLRCKYCYYQQEDRNNHEDKDLSSFTKILLKLKPDVVYLSGGEPTLEKNLYEIIDICEKNVNKTILTTNGTLINEEYAEKLLEHKVDGVLFSLDGADAKTHDYARQGFKKTIKGTDSLIEKRNKLRTKVGVCYVVHSQNLNKIEETIEYAISEDLDYFMFQPVDVFKEELANFRLSKDSLNNFIANSEMLRDKYKEKICLPSNEYFTALKNIIKKEFFGMSCFAEKSLFFIDEFFNLRECPVKFIESASEDKYCENESLNCVPMIEITRSRFLL